MIGKLFEIDYNSFRVIFILWIYNKFGFFFYKNYLLLGVWCNIKKVVIELIFCWWYVLKSENKK